MAKAKTKRRTPPREPTRAPAPEASSRPRRYNWVVWVLMVTVAAGGAFLLAKRQATAPREAVVPPPVGLPHTPDYHALTVDPVDADHLLLGTHVGVYESKNGGQHWRFLRLEGQDAMNFARASGTTIWTAGHFVLAKSTDGGLTWSDVRPDGLPDLDIHGFAIDPTDPNRMFAAVAGEGLYRSMDGGRLFRRISVNVGRNVFGLAVAPHGRLFAADPENGLFVSDDEGGSWHAATRERIVGVAVNPADQERVLAAGQPGVLLSADGGKTWRRVLSLPEGAGPVAWAPSDPKIGYAVGFDRRLYRTSDGGTSWKPVA